MSTREWALTRGRAFAELGWLPEAELAATEALRHAPRDLDALSLLAKLKHMSGELSRAIRYWAQIHDIALTDVAASTAPAPDDGLARAFELVRAGRTDEARRWCATIASHARAPHAHKQAVLTGAWIAEMRGELGTARIELEALGHEVAFAHDRERLRALLRVYDRIGTPDALTAARRICRHLLAETERAGIERLSLVGQLAVLEQRAGNAEVAADLAARFEVATRRRMHRATLGDLVRVAATEYIPVAELRAHARVDDAPPAPLARRERALVHLLRGERPDALALLADAEPLDRPYLAELAAETGHQDRAIALFLSVLDDGIGDPRAVGWLLDRHARSPSTAIARYWAAPHRRARTHQVLDAQFRLAPNRPATWRRFAVLHDLAGDRAKSHHCLSRAAAIASDVNPIGRVLAAGVYRLGGRPKGLVHEIWVERTKALPGHGGLLPAEQIHGNVTPELCAAIRSAFVAVKAYARAKLGVTDIDDYTYTYKLPKDDERSGGLSAGLPTALAFLSTFLQRPLAPGLASSGAAVAEAHDVIAIGRIGDAEHKVKAACHGNLRTLILPLENREDLEHSALVPPAITLEIVRYASDLDDAARLAFGDGVFTS